MTPEEEQRARRLAVMKRLRTDFRLFAEQNLRIRAKDTEIVPLKLNKAQEHILERLEEQIAATGRVRALILKGRQQGCCHAPETRVLTSTYQWKQIKDLRPGDRLLAFDEECAGRTAVGRKKSRRFRTTAVEAVAFLRRPRVRLTLDNGTVLITTPEHRYLGKRRGGSEPLWRSVENTRVGDSIRVITPTPQAAHPEYSWLAGILDGEGSWRFHGSPRVSAHQVAGPVLDRMREAFALLGIKPGEVIDARAAGDSSKLGHKPVYRLSAERMSDVLHVLSHCPTTRFRDEGLFDDRELPGKRADGGKSWARVVSAEHLPPGEVVDLQTQHKTYIAEGVASHNSTLIEAWFYWRAAMNKGINAYILSHEQASSDNLFDMVARYHQHNDFAPHVGTSNIKELVFDRLGSQYSVATAGAKAGGRGRTVTLFHGSEVAFWPNAKDHFASSVQAVPDMPGTAIILESTANGASGEFYERWLDAQNGKSDYIAIFVPWFWQPEYSRAVDAAFELSAEPDDSGVSEQDYATMYALTLEQMAWRRAKIAELRDPAKFRQEYPATPSEAFIAASKDSLIAPHLVLRARKRRDIAGYGPLVLGADPAGSGGDRFAVAARRGAAVEWVKWRDKVDTVTAAHWLRDLAREHRPERLYVDAGGIGHAVVSMLRSFPETVGIVSPVNFGGTSEFKRAKPKQPGPKNRRAEMWQRLKEWLELEEGVSLPDMDELSADLCAPNVKATLTNDLLLESKEEMRKRGVRSPDLADAIALTFASLNYVPVNKEPPAKPKVFVDGVTKDPAVDMGGDDGYFDEHSWMA